MVLIGGGRTIGLDLGASGVRAVEVAWRSDKPVIERWGAVDFAHEVEDWNRAGELEIGETIRTLLRQKGFRRGWAACGVCGDAVAPQYFNFPQLMAEDVPEAVRIEVEAGLPFRGENALLDYALFKEHHSEGGKIRTHGLAIAADGDFVESRLGVVRKAELDPFCVEADATACTNALLAARGHVPGEGTLAVLNVGHNYTNLALLNGEGTLFIRDVPWGGKHLTHAIAETLSVSLTEAERLKRKHWAAGPASAGKEGDRIPEVFEAHSYNLISRLRETIHYWKGERLIGELSRMFLTGGGSQIHDLPEVLSEAFSVSVERWSPFQNGSSSVSPEQEMWQYRMTVAFGLALRKFRKTRKLSKG